MIEICIFSTELLEPAGCAQTLVMKGFSDHLLCRACLPTKKVSKPSPFSVTELVATLFVSVLHTYEQT